MAYFAVDNHGNRISIGIRGYFIVTHYRTVAQEDIAADEALFYQAFLTAEGGGAASGTAAGINIVQNAYQYLCRCLVWYWETLLCPEFILMFFCS